jgi:glycosyltransferase involved in cell wall biosynthesis/SAM-dependent methyltransferase
MSQPLVSVITPCYNGQPFLQRVLDSVKNSTYTAIEQIIIDDASIDDSVTTLRSIAQDYAFQLLESDVRQGPGPARNRGVQASQGKYLLFLDCDDTIEPHFIETLVRVAEAAPEKVAPFYTPIRLQGAMDRSIGGANWSIERLVDSPFMNVCSLVPREAFDRVDGFTPQLRVLEDYDLFLKLAFAGYRGQLVPDIRLHCDIRPDSYSDHFNQRGGDAVKRRTRGLILQRHRHEIERLGLADRPKVWPYLNGREGDVGEFDLSRTSGLPIPQDPASVANPASQPAQPAQPAETDTKPAIAAEASAAKPDKPPQKYPDKLELVEAVETIEVEPIADMLLSLIPGDAKRVLEVGCGDGAMGEQFKRVAPACHYTGIAFTAEDARHAATKIDRVIAEPIAALPQLDAEPCDIAPGSLDCIVYRLEAAESSYFEAILAQQQPWLRPEGIVLFALPNPNYWGEIVAFLSGQRRPRGYTIEEAQQMCGRSGLTSLDVRVLDETGDEPPETLATWLYDRLDDAAQAFRFDPAMFKVTARTSHHIFRVWKAPAKPRLLMVQTLLISKMASDRVRVYQPDRLLQTVPGVRINSNVHALTLLPGRPNEEKVFIWQRAQLDLETGIARQQRILRDDYLTVAEIDDDPRFWASHIESDFFTFRSCHCVQTSTEPLAEFLRQFNPYVKVLPNQLPELPPPRVYDDRAPVTIFFGALNREPDWQPLMAGLNRTLNDFGDRIHVRVVHDRHFYNALETPHKSFEATCTYDRYHEILRECDVALLPLNPTEFNGMKSDLKFIECAGRGVVTLVSPTVYKGSIEHGKTALMFQTPEEFEVLLHQVIENDDWRREIAANAYAHVRDRRLISHHYRERYDWYLEMRDRLPELNAALRDRVPELFEGLA